LDSQLINLDDYTGNNTGTLSSRGNFNDSNNANMTSNINLQQSFNSNSPAMSMKEKGSSNSNSQSYQSSLNNSSISSSNQHGSNDIKRNSLNLSSILKPDLNEMVTSHSNPGMMSSKNTLISTVTNLTPRSLLPTIQKQQSESKRDSSSSRSIRRNSSIELDQIYLTNAQ
jgi:hypothetical protein